MPFNLCGTKINSKVFIYIPVIMLILAILACSVDENLGTISPLSRIECTPVQFVLKGETDSVWQGDLASNTEYEVTIQMVSQQHPINQVHILVMDESTNLAGNIVSSIADGIAKTSFISPDDGQVTIRVSSPIGEFQQDLGEHTITVCAIDD